MKLDAWQQATADAAFGTDLYKALAGPGNLVLSPASIAAALRMALIGARGETAEEMARVLHLPSAEAARAASDELASIPAGGDITLRVVNTAWIESGLSVRRQFLDQPVAVRRAGFAGDPEGSRRAINAAVAEQTDGKVSDLIGPGVIGALTRLVLVSALYLKARWQHEFPEQQTKTDNFYPERTSPTQVPMMRLSARLAYHRGDGYQAVLLPYRGGPLAMAIVLPDGPLSEFPLGQRGGVSGVLAGLLAGSQYYQVDLRLPKFKVTSGFLLRDTLQSLGLTRAFSGEADFTGITEQEPLRISEAVHRAYIDVDEHGTEAAAATAVVMRTLAAIRPPDRRVTFIADRPFTFAVVTTDAGLPLFLGQFTVPPRGA